ncbi:hypothetical protein [Brucella intermedia]|uniref:hypothetical protein n=1 Tax=Brucella intermedia TaxID=94625 RepID=UPI0012FD3ED9|nr:hypothetical protein [Brucella intermedia]
MHSGHWPATHATAAPTSSSSLLVSHVVSLIRARDCAPDQNDKEGDVGGRLRTAYAVWTSIGVVGTSLARYLGVALMAALAQPFS